MVVLVGIGTVLGGGVCGAVWLENDGRIIGL